MSINIYDKPIMHSLYNKKMDSTLSFDLKWYFNLSFYYFLPRIIGECT